MDFLQYLTLNLARLMPRSHESFLWSFLTKRKSSEMLCWEMVGVTLGQVSLDCENLGVKKLA